MAQANQSPSDFRGDNLSVKMFGGVGDGSHDDSAAIQSGIDYIAARGGGHLTFPKGTWLAKQITLRPLVWLQGAGFGCTVIKLPGGANTWMFKSAGFDALFATIAAHTDPTAPAPGSTPDLSMGIWGFGFESLSLNGNKANNSAGDGLSIYGYNYNLRHLMIYGFAGTGLTTGWSNSADFPDWTDALETNFFHLKIHDNGNDGWRMNGPHDSTVIGVECYQNAGKNFWQGRNGDSSYLRLHCYGAVADIGAQFDEEATLSQCVFESAAQVQLQMNAGLNGDCAIFSQPTGSLYANSKGLVIGDASHTTVNNVRLKVFAFNCQKGLIDTTYAGGGGGNRLDLQGFNSSGTPLVFVNGTNTAGYAAALLLLIDYDFNLWVNGSGLGFIHMSNTSGVTQNALVVQGKDSGIELGMRIQGTSATSPTNPLMGLIRNGTVPTSFQIYSYDGTNFVNWLEFDVSTGLVQLKGAVYPTDPGKGKVIAGIAAAGPVPAKWISIAAPSNNDFLRGRTSQTAGLAWEAPPIVAADGGTGLVSLTAHAVMLGNGVGVVQFASPGTAGFLLTSNGSGADPSFAALSAGALPTGINANKLSSGVVSNTEFDYLDGVTSAIQTQLDAKAPQSTTYTKSEVDAFVAALQAQIDSAVATHNSDQTATNVDLTSIHAELGGMTHP